MRIQAGIVLLALAAMAACGGDDGIATTTGSSTTTALTEVPQGGTTAPMPTDTVQQSGGAPPPAAGSAPGDGPATTSPPGTSQDAADPRPLDDGGPPGSFGAELLGARTGHELAVAVLAQDGAAPAPETVEHVVGLAAAASGKDVTVSPGSVPGGERAWTADDIRSLARSVGPPQRDGRVAVRLLFLHGSFADDDGTLGVAVDGASAAVFVDRIADSAALGVGAGRLQQAVAAHELGHLFGLVDLLVDTGRDDPEHPGHSPSTGSVMYWAVESDLVGQVLGGGPPVDFDDADLADLARIRRLGS